tara:strand:- start:466 stop:867 length:402 start_codon:yes stop_codon:yes gene_type:complete
MGFKVHTKDNFPTGQLTEVKCYYDEVTGAPADAPGDGIGEVIFRSRPILVGDMGLLQDADKDPTYRFKDIARELLVEVEGLEDADGKPIEKMTDEIIESLPIWMVSTIAEALSADANLTEEGETFSEPPSGTS